MGNRVKGRVKKKSIKAAVHSGMATHRKLSRMGKVRKKDHAGLDATFIGRAKVLKKLQISLKDFRRLCILKGVYPREPRGRAPRNKKGQVFYHAKDVKALSHEPLLDKFREFKSFMKKVRRSANRNEKEEARRKQPLAPKYTLHHLVRERYPRFADALGDLDDALCLVNLFACLPSEGRIQTSITRKAQHLAASWGAYCATTGSITKSFISVKGVYMEAEIMVSSLRYWGSKPSSIYHAYGILKIVCTQLYISLLAVTRSSNSRSLGRSTQLYTACASRSRFPCHANIPRVLRNSIGICAV